MTLQLPDVIDYTSRDYASIRDDLLGLIPTFVPDWTSTSENDLGIVLLELWSYVGDQLNYNIDRIANEGFLDTAVQRSSIIRLAAMLGYTPSNAIAAQTSLSFTNSSSVTVDIPALTQVATTADSVNDTQIIFETATDVSIAPSATATGVVANQGVTVTDLPYIADGSIDQSFTLFNNDVIQGSVSIAMTVGASTTVWTYQPNLLNAGPFDNAFTLLTDATGIVTVQFGDGANGVVPINGASVVATYRTGGGVVGNVSAGSLTTIISTIPPGITVTNPAAASGGVDVESTSSIQQNAPSAFSTLQRCVTLNDYSNYAVLVPGVGAASAVSTVPSSVTVYIMPSGGGTASASLIAEAQAALNLASPVPTTVTVLSGTNVEIDAVVTLYLANSAVASVAQAEGLAALQDLFSFDNVILGDTITPNDIYTALAGVDGLLYANVSALYIDGNSPAVNIISLLASQFPVAGPALTVTTSGGV